MGIPLTGVPRMDYCPLYKLTRLVPLLETIHERAVMIENDTIPRVVGAYAVFLTASLKHLQRGKGNAWPTHMARLDRLRNVTYLPSSYRYAKDLTRYIHLDHKDMDDLYNAMSKLSLDMFYVDDFVLLCWSELVENMFERFLNERKYSASLFNGSMEAI